MDTPKRIKTSLSSQHYVSSPPSGGNPAIFNPNSFPGTPGSDSKQFQHHHHHGGGYGSATSGNVPGWPPETLTSPVSACGSPPGSWKNHHSGGGQNTSSGGMGSAEKLENKRGRPRSEALTTLMVEGSISPSAIKCRYCNRVFPREKSLQAHLRTHTGERPYQCDYPGCTRAFTQSGQLKTHQRLHTGERPFICSAVNCQMRFTHANRHCPDHPYDTLKRCDDFVIQAVPEQNSEVLKWLEKYRLEREDRTPTRKTPKRSANHHHHGGVGGGGLGSGQNENENRSCGNNENYGGSAFQSPITPRSPFKSRKGLMCELDMNAGLGLAASPITAKTKPNVPKLIQWQEPTSQEEDESGDESVAGNGATPTRFTFNPKKKWLRDAWQEDLAKPLEPSIISPQVLSSTTSTAALKQQLNQSTELAAKPTETLPNPNQMRPTVLMVASKDTARPLNDPPPSATPLTGETNRKLQGALALMQLATEDSSAATAAAFINQYPTDLLATVEPPTPAPIEPTPPPPQQRIPPMLSYRPGEIDHSIPFTLAAETFANYQ